MWMILTSTVVAITVSQGASAGANRGSILTSSVCEKEAEKLTGVVAVRVGKGVKQPKRIHYVAPKYPSLPAGTSGTGRQWAGEFLIGIDGKVVQVWTSRDLRFTPPFPPFARAIVDSIKSSVYEPVIIEGRARPVCTTVVITINWS